MRKYLCRVFKNDDMQLQFITEDRSEAFEIASDFPDCVLKIVTFESEE